MSDRAVSDRAVNAAASLVLLAHVALAVTHGGPVAVPDVPSYLSVPQWLAGGLEPPPFGHHPGYGLLLAPAALAGLGPDALHTAALLLNGVLAAGAVLLAAALARALAPGAPRWVPVAAAATAALHPSLSSASRIAWPETLLGVLVLAAALLAVRAARTRLPTASAAVGFVATIGVAAHPRMVTLAAVSALAVAASRPGRRQVVAFVAGASAAAALTALALAVAYTGPASAGRASAAVEGAGDGAGLLTTFAGQFVTLAASTAGLAAVGLLDALRRSGRLLRWRDPLDALERDRLVAAVLIGGGALATALVAAASLGGSDRADTFAYGRYLDPYTVALVVLALATPALSSRRLLLIAGAIVAGATAVVWWKADLVARPGMRVMVLGTDLWWRLSDGELVPALLAGCAVALLGLAGWALAGHVPPARAAMVALTALALGASTLSGHLHLRAVGEVSAGQATAAQVLRGMGERAPACLAHDRTGVPTYVLWLYRMQLPATEHRRVDLAAGESPCSNLVVAHERDSLLATCPAAHLIQGEPAGSWALWELAEGACAAVPNAPEAARRTPGVSQRAVTSTSSRNRSAPSSANQPISAWRRSMPTV